MMLVTMQCHYVMLRFIFWFPIPALLICVRPVSFPFCLFPFKELNEELESLAYPTSNLLVAGTACTNPPADRLFKRNVNAGTVCGNKCHEVCFQGWPLRLPFHSLSATANTISMSSTIILETHLVINVRPTFVFPYSPPATNHPVADILKQCPHSRSHVCMPCPHSRMYVCMYACLCPYSRMYVCMYVCMCVCVYVCMYVCMYVYMYVSVHTHGCMYVSMYLCMYMYVCMSLPTLTHV